MIPSADVARAALGQIVIRLLEPAERDRFDQVLVEKHYLHSARIGGRSLRYVAELNGEWVALLCFSGAAPHVKAREKWIGWNVRQRARRLGMVVNNSRFLVLTDRHVYPNLASRVLGLCLKRVDADWQRQWETPILLIESFVDESLYRGTCYRACGFEAVGLSAGYGRDSRDYYLKHDQPKQLYLRALRRDAAAILRQGRLPAKLAVHEQNTSGPCPLRAEALGSLLEAFQTLGDRRRGHGLRHPQPFVLACATVGMLMGAGGYEAMEDQCAKLTQRQLRALGCRYNQKKQRDPGVCPTARNHPPTGGQHDHRRRDAMPAGGVALPHPTARRRLPLRPQRQSSRHPETSERETPAGVFFPLSTTPAGVNSTADSNAAECSAKPSPPRTPACAVADSSSRCGASASISSAPGS
jgi:hypothetical protein